MAGDNDVIETLEDLIETCRDGERGFLTAAESVGDAALQRLFTGYATQRAEFATELGREVRRLGGEPRERGSVGGAIHRGWMQVKSALTGHDRERIVAAAESGEDHAKRAYEDALNVAGLPADVRAVVARQYAAVKAAHDSVRALKRAA